MKQSEQLSVKSDLMSTLEYYITNYNFSSPVDYAEKHFYGFDLERFNSDDDYKKEVLREYNNFVERAEYKNSVIYKLCDYLYKV